MDDLNNKPLFDDIDDNSLFEEPLKPSKPWYKRWWLIAYGVIFVVSIFVLIIFSSTTNQVLDNIDLEDGANFDFINTDSGFSPVPGAVTSESPDLNTLAATLVGSQDDPSIGKPGAPVTIVEFADFGCPYCRESSIIIKQLITKYPDDVYFVFRDFPVTELHPEAVTAAQAGQCAHEQNLFWPYHDLLFTNQDNLDNNTILRLAGTVGLDLDKFSSCIDNKKYLGEVLADFDTGINLGVAGTPTFFVNGFSVAGVVPIESWEQIIELVKLTQ